MSKTILITGCSSGIGYDAAHGLREHGWRVFASCRKHDDCERLKSEGFDSPLVDYQNPASIDKGLAETLEATSGKLAAVFNNGAFASPGLVEDLPTDALRAIFEANFFGWHELTRKVIPIMRKQGYGRIVQCSSILGFITLPWRGAYNSTKFALEGLSDTLRIEMRGTGIKVILIEPGPITSKIRRNSIPHLERWIDHESSARSGEYQNLIYRLHKESVPDKFELPASAVTKKLIPALESPRPRPRYYVTTPTYTFGILKRMLPTRILDWLLGKV